MEARNSETGSARLLVGLVVAGVVVLCLLGLYGYASSIRNQALAWETDLNKVVRVEVSERATYEMSITEQVGLSGVKADRMREIIGSAMAGRYGDKPNQGQALLQVVKEAYPGTEGLNIYDRVLPSIQAGREAIRNKQNLRIEKAQAYDNWRKTGIFRAWILSGIYPSRDLRFRVGDVDYFAVEALLKMSEPISTDAVNKTFETGKEKAIQFK